mmetsp:Transcript_1215/g.1383  ORF Transcript_1215/g.1383 Transcript_1215/m.1383 type:complete len:200 (+) Transcript_1215:438-1037(+)
MIYKVLEVYSDALKTDRPRRNNRRKSGVSLNFNTEQGAKYSREILGIALFIGSLVDPLRLHRAVEASRSELTTDEKDTLEQINEFLVNKGRPTGMYLAPNKVKTQSSIISEDFADFFSLLEDMTPQQQRFRIFDFQTKLKASSGYETYEMYSIPEVNVLLSLSGMDSDWWSSDYHEIVKTVSPFSNLFDQTLGIEQVKE